LPTKPEHRFWLASAALFVLSALAYANSFHTGFVLDNRWFILGDRRIRLATSDNLALIFHHTLWWPRSEAGLYRPLTTLSLLFNYAILGNADSPVGYHAINLLLHAINVLLVFALARRLMPDPRAQFLAAAIWAVHPVLTESVTNIVGRADLLAGMATLGALLMYLKAAEASGLPRAAWITAMALTTAAGVFAKESAAVIPAVILLYELTWWNRSRLRILIPSLAALSPALLALWWARTRVGATLGRAEIPFVDNPIIAADFITGRLTAIKVLAEYLALLIWPAHLSADHSYAQIPLATGTPTDWLSWLTVAAVAAAVAFLYRRHKTAFFAAMFALITILPTSNLLIPVGTIMAERFLYLPAIGFSLCLTLALCRLPSRGPLIAGVLIVAAFGIRTAARNRDWQDEITIWTAAVRDSPDSFKSHLGLAKALIADDHDLNIDHALAEYDQGLAILDSLPPALSGSDFYIRAGKLHLDKATLLTPGDPESPPEFRRARELLVRGKSLMQREETRENPTGLPTPADLYVDSLISQTDAK
jgi:protein O-mannosyl-transferase